MSDSVAIAIDGPSASGKSTTAREVAATLGFVHLNSGLLYRAVTWIALRDGWSTDREFAAGLTRLRISLTAAPPEFEVRIDGSVPGAWLQASEVNARVSAVAARADVRERVTEALRAAATQMCIVMDGRDIGTVVLPEATLKVFLTATLDVRARRRLAEQPGEATEDSVSGEVSRLTERDRLDATRQIAPLARADDAVELDTTNLTPQEVVTKIVELYRAKMPPTG